MQKLPSILRTFSLAMVLLAAGQMPAQDIAAMDSAAFRSYLLSLNEKQSEKGPEFRIRLSREDAIRDLKILRRVLEEAQTSLYRYTDRRTLDRSFARAMDIPTDSVTYLDLVGKIAQLQNTIACGHSGWGHHPGFFAFRNEHLRFFPLDLQAIEGRFYVLRDCTPSNGLPAGVEVLSINGIGMDSLAHRMRRHMFRDGESADHSDYEICRFFTNAYSNFIGNPDEFKLSVSWPGKGEAMQFMVPALPRHEIDSLRELKYGPDAGMGLPLCLEVNDSTQTAVYTIKWFSKEYMARQGQDFERFTDSVFSEIDRRGIDHLIIDLRGNPGGWTAHGKYLFSYFIDREMPYVERVEAKKYRDFSFAPIVRFEAGYADTMDLQLNAAGLYEWKNYPSLTVAPAPNHRFRGRTYVLIDGGSHSCSSVFASLVREHTDAVFVGEETGGTRCGTAGMVMGIRLPFSGIQYHFSTACYTLAVKDQGNVRGVVPDFPVQPGVRLPGQDNDPVMEMVKRLIGMKRR